MMECLLIRESTPFFILHTDFWRKPCNYKIKNTRGEMMEAPVSKEKQNPKIVNYPPLSSSYELT